MSYLSKKPPKSRKVSHIRTGVTVIIALFLFVIYFSHHSPFFKNPFNSSKSPSVKVTTDKTNSIKPPNGEEMPIEIPTSKAVAAAATHGPPRSGTSSIQGIIKETNRVRRDNGLPPLTENFLLDRVAKERVEDMFQKQYFGHISPSGQGAAEITRRVGYHYKVLAENIVATSMYTTDRNLIDGWMQSPGHRENILNDKVRDIGVAAKKGFLKGRKQWVAVQIFGLRLYR